jgi:PKD repeat protein
MYLRLNHLDPTYLVAPEHNIPVSDCELRDKTRPSNRIDIYNAGNVCGIQVRLTAEEDMKYLVPDENKRFGLAPLIMKQVYNKLRLGVQYINVPGKPVANLGLTWGQSDATATQQFFSAVTSVKLASRTITEINAEGPASLRSILDKYRTSPVFFSTYTTIFVITGHEGDGKQRTWHMLGVRSTREQKWTEEQFQLFKDSTFLYQAEDGGLAAGREECLPADILG